MSLDEVRKRWLEEQSLYEEVAKNIADRMSMLLRNHGIFGIVTWRIKEMDSLIKKAIRKSYAEPYDEILDKAGVRVVVRFLDEVKPACEIIRGEFHIVKEDDKIENLGPSEFGYLGVHFDIVSDDRTRPAAASKDMPCELQVHTLCQNVWAGQSHILAYKSLIKIPRKIERTLHRASALLEAADQSFNESHANVVGHPDFPNVQLLTELEKSFFRYAARDYDAELSLRVMACILECYGGNLTCAIENVRRFVEQHDETLARIYDEYGKIAERSAFLFQPEALAIFERLESNSFELKKAWDECQLPTGELVRMAQVWGVEVEDVE